MSKLFRRVYVSATAQDLGTYKRDVIEILSKNDIVQITSDNITCCVPIISLLHYLENKIKTCDAVICLVGKLYGGEFTFKRSLQQIEYELALKYNVPVFIFLTTEIFKPDNSVTEDAENSVRQLCFRENIIKSNIRFYLLSQRARFREEITRIVHELASKEISEYNETQDIVNCYPENILEKKQLCDVKNEITPTCNYIDDTVSEYCRPAFKTIEAKHVSFLQQAVSSEFSGESVKKIQRSACETFIESELVKGTKAFKSPIVFESHIKDRVDCTVFAPPSVYPKQNFLLQVFAHLPVQKKEAEILAVQFDESTQSRGFKSLNVEIELGWKLNFSLRIPGLVVDYPIQYLIWNGRPESVQFPVKVPLDIEKKEVIGTINIDLNSTPVGVIHFKLKIEHLTGSTQIIQEIRPVGNTAKHYNNVFVSYSWRNRKEVQKRVQMLDLIGISYFQDLLSIKPGQRFEKLLYEYIDQCDLFLLFWSVGAKKSKWVYKEVKYALNRKAGDYLAPPEIRPVILKGAHRVKPWREIDDLSFNDMHLYFMSGI